MLYLAGFDPQGPSPYHSLYRREAALQAAVGGYDVEVGPRQRAGAHGSAWDVSWRGRRAESGASEAGGEAAGADVYTRYETLRWDDLVRQHWPPGQWAAIRLTAWNSWQLTRNGSFWRFLHISWPAVLALALPGMLLLGVGTAVLALLWGMAALVGAGYGMSAAVLGTAVGAALWRAARWAQDKMYMGWLMR
ncbi:MAG TPA: hypothetical protein VLA16_05720, partial [Ideonella sp.]|nr:hypothetical protein [Ideonella sp.]